MNYTGWKQTLTRSLLPLGNVEEWAQHTATCRCPVNDVAIGQGCPSCNTYKNANVKCNSTSIYVNQSTELLNNRWDFSSLHMSPTLTLRKNLARVVHRPDGPIDDDVELVDDGAAKVADDRLQRLGRSSALRLERTARRRRWSLGGGRWVRGWLSVGDFFY